MQTYRSTSVSAELMRADVCGKYSRDPDKALKRCQSDPQVGRADPESPAKLLELKRPESLTATPFNAAVLRFLQTHGDHVTLWDGLLPLVATVQDLKKTGSSMVNVDGGLYRGSRVFVDRDWLSRNPRLMFSVLCQALADHEVHPAWSQLVHSLSDKQAQAFGKAIGARISEEACGGGWSDVLATAGVVLAAVGFCLVLVNYDAPVGR